MTSPFFYAKILLFGEYGIIENSRGLTFPYSYYQGALKYIQNEKNEFEINSNLSLLKYCQYLEKLEIPESFSMDVAQLKEDISKGLFFDSNIPQGYGVGSSGALVAAVFERYSLRKMNPEELSKDKLKELRQVFASMEGFFHGKSSGIDPLICYMRLPILIEGQEIDRAEIPKEKKGKGAIFLIDSGIVGETGPMVQIFFEKLKNEGFRKTLREEFIKYNNACIRYFLSKEFNPFFKNLKKLSRWVLKHFRPMIPENLFSIWKTGLETNAYYLKLCGSGGGGYILGFTEDYEKAEKMLEGFSKEVIYRF